jgi:hypothetical protein
LALAVVNNTFCEGNFFLYLSLFHEFLMIYVVVVVHVRALAFEKQNLVAIPCRLPWMSFLIGLKKIKLKKVASRDLKINFLIFPLISLFLLNIKIDNAIARLEVPVIGANDNDCLCVKLASYE